MSGLDPVNYAFRDTTGTASYFTTEFLQVDPNSEKYDRSVQGDSVPALEHSFMRIGGLATDSQATCP